MMVAAKDTIGFNYEAAKQKSNKIKDKVAGRGHDLWWGTLR